MRLSKLRPNEVVGRVAPRAPRSFLTRGNFSLRRMRAGGLEERIRLRAGRPGLGAVPRDRDRRGSAGKPRRLRRGGAFSEPGDECAHKRIARAHSVDGLNHERRDVAAEAWRVEPRSGGSKRHEKVQAAVRVPKLARGPSG